MIVIPERDMITIAIEKLIEKPYELGFYIEEGYKTSSEILIAARATKSGNIELC